MKVLIINTVAFELNGITSVIMNYYRNINKENLQIDFVTINEINSDFISEFKKNQSAIYTIDRKKKTLFYMLSLIKIMKKNKYDIVHIHGNSSTMAIETVAAYIARIPVRIVHSHNTTCTHRVLHKILYPMLKFTYTNKFACGLEAGKWLFKDEEFEIIKNGVDLNKFKYSSIIRKEYRKRINAENMKVIGHVGNFVFQKNHKFLIKVFKELLKIDENYLLLLIGDGEYLKEIKAQVEELGISNSVVFVGKTSEVNKYMQAMDMFLLPSYFEGLPLVLIEAQAIGLPCLVSDKVSEESNITELVKFIPINDTDIWVKKIIEQESLNIEENSKKAQFRIQEEGFDIKNSAEMLKGIYEKYLMRSRE